MSKRSASLPSIFPGFWAPFPFSPAKALHPSKSKVSPGLTDTVTSHPVDRQQSAGKRTQHRQDISILIIIIIISIPGVPRHPIWDCIAPSTVMSTQACSLDSLILPAFRTGFIPMQDYQRAILSSSNFINQDSYLFFELNIRSWLRALEFVHLVLGFRGLRSWSP